MALLLEGTIFEKLSLRHQKERRVSALYFKVVGLYSHDLEVLSEPFFTTLIFSFQNYFILFYEKSLRSSSYGGSTLNSYSP
jgi:hypothetical protein